MCVTVWVLRYKNKKNGDRGTIVFTATLNQCDAALDSEIAVNTSGKHGHVFLFIALYKNPYLDLGKTLSGGWDNVFDMN